MSNTSAAEKPFFLLKFLNQMIYFKFFTTAACGHWFFHDQIPAGRDTGNDFFVSQISGGSVTFPGTRIVG